MSYTGHKNRKMPDGKTIVEWLRPIVEDECRYHKVPTPSDRQIATVVRAMRMHHLMEHAAQYDTSELGKPDKVTQFWPIESSIGRFLRDSAGDVLEGRDDE